MSLANHRAQVSELLDDWAENQKQAKNLINCLVQFLSEDIHWLKSNISKVDAEILAAIAKATGATHD
jgi:hypothetical protein